MTAPDRNRALLGGLLLLAFVVLLRTAWISDDALITLRTALNLLHGYGPNFNIDERVQAYTHPLWFLLLAAGGWVTGQLITVTYLFGILLSLAVIALLVTRATNDRALGLAGGLLLVLSKAWVDFATSGLENPLAHLLVLALFLLGIVAVERRDPRRLTPFFLLCSLLYLTRPDLLLLVAPLALWVLARAGARPAAIGRSLAIGALPALAWTAFSLFYYGFPFPNTAYAKLGAGIELVERLPQGGRYFLDSLQRDPLTLVTVIAGVAAGLQLAGAPRALAVGIAAYLAWVASIGGDFMSGRFFTAPLVAAVAILVRWPLPRARLGYVLAPVLALGAFALPSTLLSGSDYDDNAVNDSGIANERGYFYQNFGMLSPWRQAFGAPDWVPGTRDFAVVCGGLGFYALTEGPSVHVIDYCGLADPLLARLPAKRDEHWRIGHFYRQLPTDYVQSVYHGENLLTDPAAHGYYDIIRRVTRGPLLDPVRLGDIVRLNLGQVAPPDPRLYRDGDIPRSSRTPEVALADLVPGGRPLGFVQVLDIRLPAPVSIRAFGIGLSHNDFYRLSYRAGNRYVTIGEFVPDYTTGGSTVTVSRSLPAPTPPTDRLRIEGSFGDGRYVLDGLRINP